LSILIRSTINFWLSKIGFSCH